MDGPRLLFGSPVSYILNRCCTARGEFVVETSHLCKELSGLDEIKPLFCGTRLRNFDSSIKHKAHLPSVDLWTVDDFPDGEGCWF